MLVLKVGISPMGPLNVDRKTHVLGRQQIPDSQVEVNSNRYLMDEQSSILLKSIFVFDVIPTRRLHC